MSPRRQGSGRNSTVVPVAAVNESERAGAVLARFAPGIAHWGGMADLDPNEAEGRVLQQQARALGDPTRHAIFRHIASAGQPVRVSELADRLALHHNAVRQHLAKLCAAGLLIEEVGPRAGPGRPALQYRLDAGASSRWDAPTPYRELSVHLAELASGTRTAREVGVEVGRTVGGQASGDALDVIQAEMTRRGFQPRRLDIEGSPALVLERCAFQEAASTAPHVVCELHKGLAEGIIETVGGYEGCELHVNDPMVAGCRLQLRRKRQ